MPGVASTTFSPDVAIKGLVGTPRSFTFDDLKQLPAETVNVSFQAGQGTTNASFTGTRLLNVFDAASGAKLPNDVNNAKLRVTVMVTGADGYQVVLGWGELDPDFGAAPIMLAYLQRRPADGRQSKVWRGWSCQTTSAAAATSRPSRASRSSDPGPAQP